MIRCLNKLLIVLIGTIIVLSFGTIACYADVISSGECGADGSNVTWTVDDHGVLTISGSGKMEDYEPSRRYSYQNYYFETVIIENGVTEIGDYAFNSCENLISITIPDSVNRIGSFAFKNCVSLKTISIPNGIKTISKGSFLCCESLTEFDIPNSVNVICELAFAACYSLTSINIPNSVNNIQAQAFYLCTGLRSVCIPYGETIIRSQTFFGCDNLTSISIPNSVVIIDSNAFEGCNGLKDVYYNGGKAKWESIKINLPNVELENATIHYGTSDDPDNPIIPCPVIWTWGKDNYSFGNTYSSFGEKGNPIYISNKDFSAFLSILDNTEIAQMAEWFGYGNDYMPQLKLINFLKNNLDTWGGSCYGMSLTAALFNAGLLNTSSFGGDSTNSIPAIDKNTNSNLESFINVYQISQACNIPMRSQMVYSIYDEQFPRFIDTFFNKAIAIDKQEKVMMICMQADNNNDGDNEKCHALLCYGAEYGDWNVKERQCNRRLLIADPNMNDETYVYISSDSKFAVYSGDEDYTSFGYHASKLSDLNCFEYNKEVINLFHDIIVSTRKNVIIVGSDPYCKVTIKDGRFFIDKDSVDFLVDVIHKMDSDNDDSSQDVYYRLSGESASYKVLPLDNKEVDTSLYFPDCGISVKGDFDSATLNSEGKVQIEGADETVSVGFVANDSKLDFVTVSGSTEGNVDIDLDDNKLSVAGEISDYTVSNMDRNAETKEVSVAGDYDKTIKIDDNNNLDVSDYEEKTHTHSYGKWVVTKAATEIKTGKKERKCAVCGEIETQIIPVMAPTLPMVKISGVKSVKRVVTVSWKKVSRKTLKRVKKVQIQYSKDKNFKKSVKTVTVSAKKSSKKIKGLTKGKKYYVRLRAYTKSGSTVHVSNWSAKKNIKVK